MEIGHYSQNSHKHSPGSTFGLYVMGSHWTAAHKFTEDILEEHTIQEIIDDTGLATVLTTTDSYPAPH